MPKLVSRLVLGLLALHTRPSKFVQRSGVEADNNQQKRYTIIM